VFLGGLLGCCKQVSFCVLPLVIPYLNWAYVLGVVLKGIVKKKEEGLTFVIDGPFIFLFLFVILSASKPKRS
jgi:ABC-type uncharacterized transport system YnjBCD permease subunit